MSRGQPVPAGWREVKLGTVAQTHRGITWSASQEVPTAISGAVPVLRIPNIQERLDTSDIRFLVGVSEDQKRKHAATLGWSLMVGSNGNPDRVGNCVFVDQPNDYLFASFLVGVESTTVDQCDPRFLYWILSNTTIQRMISDDVQGSTGLKNINLAMLRAASVLLPPLPEQRKIAAILSSVDVAIEKAESLIAKLHGLKIAMMQELLTKGIGHTRFKDSPVGRIPEEWEVVTLEELVKKERPITYGIVQTGPHVAGGIPCVRVIDIVKPELCLGDMIRTTSAISDQYRRTLLQRGDIMFALRGEIGHVVLVPDSLIGANLTRGVALISPIAQVVPHFLLWALRSDAVRAEIADQVNGSALQEVPLGGLRRVRVQLPPVDEQKRIAGLLDSTERRIRADAVKLIGLGSLKKALMQDLLTGRVRVKV